MTDGDEGLNDLELFEKERQEWIAVHLRLPSPGEEGDIWQRLEDRKLLQRREKELDHGSLQDP